MSDLDRKIYDMDLRLKAVENRLFPPKKVPPVEDIAAFAEGRDLPPVEDNSFYKPACSYCGHYRDTPNHELGCEVGRLEAQQKVEGLVADKKRLLRDLGALRDENLRLMADNERLRQRVSTLEQDNALLRKRLGDWKEAEQ